MLRPLALLILLSPTTALAAPEKKDQPTAKSFPEMVVAVRKDSGEAASSSGRPTGKRQHKPFVAGQ